MAQAIEQLPTDAADQPDSAHGSRLQTVGLGLALLLIVMANLGLRRNLEQAPIPVYPLFERLDAEPWQLLLPLDWGKATGDPYSEGVVHWSTTSLIVIQRAAQYVSLNRIYYALNAALIVSTFVCSWWMFRSAVFTLTLTICMAFGTQFHWARVCSPVMSLYLFAIYLEANLLCWMKVVQTGQRAWKIGFVVSLIVLALSTENWLDYLAFLTVGSAFLLVYAWRAQDTVMRRRVGMALLTSWVIAGIYLAIRLSLGRQQYHPGNESEMIFTYSSPILAIEDFGSNVITYLYIAISNYFPPFLTSSNSLYRLGSDYIIEQQHGYHEAKSHLVASHHMFSWYFSAGIVFTVFVYYLVRNAQLAVQTKSVNHLYLTLAMLMVACGMGVHTLVKYRPYLSVPLLTYKCAVSDVGVAFLLAFGLMYARRLLPRPRLVYPLLIVLVWSVIGWGALARPAYLSHLSREMGMGEMPDPRRNIRLPRLLRAPTVTAENPPKQGTKP